MRARLVPSTPIPDVPIKFLYHSLPLRPQQSVRLTYILYVLSYNIFVYTSHLIKFAREKKKFICLLPVGCITPPHPCRCVCPVLRSYSDCLFR